MRYQEFFKIRKFSSVKKRADKGFHNYFAARHFKYLRREMRALILILNADPFATSAAPGVR